MKLQLALDFVPSFESARETIEKVKDSIDIVEVGTVWVVQDGLHAVKYLKEQFPSLSVLADLKIMDAGEHEAEMGFKAGADIVTVMGFTDDATIRGAVKAAEKYHGKVMVDLMCVPDQGKRAKQVVDMGCDYACVHTAIDVQGGGISPYADLAAVREAVGSGKTAIAGGISMETIGAVCKEQPEIIIVGGAITSKDDMAAAAKELKESME